MVAGESISDHVNNNNNDEDIWALSEGYTPLHDGILQSDTGFLVATSHSTTFTASDATIFFQTTHEEDEEDSSELPSTHHTPETTSDDEYYQTIADRALRMLECDYQNTVQNQQKMVQTQSNTETFDEPNQSCITQHEQELTMMIETEEEQQHGKNVQQSFFHADFDQLSNLEANETSRTRHSVVNSDAVLRAVESIRSNDTRLTKKFEAWDRQYQQRRQRTLPSIHPIVPSASLAAFHNSTSKAIQASARFSRSATLAEALRRLDIIRGSSQDLHIHVVGCDAVECNAIESTFGPIVRWLGNYVECPGTLHFDLIGPNIPSQVCTTVHNLMPKSSRTAVTRMRSATAQCHSCLYHELQSDDPPDLVVAFNAGIWGYDDWIPCLDFILSRGQTIPFVATAYTTEEAEDDYDVIEAHITKRGINSSERSEWPAEANPFGSQLLRETASAVVGREYRENAAWQAWSL